ncbi:class I SAM-dependent methyltransferase [Flavobacteriaceae bacterium]|nr:class I SAM-dependent methyltransferase [Flavobacteriaceae bacterium]
MKKINIFLFLITGLVLSNECVSQELNTDKKYTFKRGDFNGIGKWYMGREIAYVMGFQGIGWLERSDREKEENVSNLIQNMRIKSNDTIADIGAGSGYHVFRMSPLTKKGLVYAVDIQSEMLMEIEKTKEFNKITNVETIIGSEKSIHLPKNSVDKILMVDVYHEFNFPVEMITSIKKALKPNGHLFLIEYRGEDSKVPIKKIHKMTEKQAVKELEVAGFKLKENIDNLPWQHCMVFIKK